MGPRNPVGFNEECPRVGVEGMGLKKLPYELGRIRCAGKAYFPLPPPYQPWLRSFQEQGLDNRIAVRTLSVFRVRPGGALR